MDAARVGGDVFGFGAGVFSAVQGAQRIDFAYRLAVGIISQPGANVGEFAAGATADTLAATGFINGQKCGEGSPDFGGPGVLGGWFIFNNSHN